MFERGRSVRPGEALLFRVFVVKLDSLDPRKVRVASTWAPFRCADEKHIRVCNAIVVDDRAATASTVE